MGDAVSAGGQENEWMKYRLATRAFGIQTNKWRMMMITAHDEGDLTLKDKARERRNLHDLMDHSRESQGCTTVCPT